MNKRGNVVAVIIVAIIILVTLVVLTQDYFKAPIKPITESKKIREETAAAVQRAVQLGISEWGEKGFTDAEPVWLCDVPNVPSESQVKSSLRDTIDKKLEAVLESLKKERRYEFSGPSVIQIDSLKGGDILSVKVEELKVALEEGKTFKELDVSEMYEFKIRAWKMYEKLDEWASNYAGGLTGAACGLLSKPCQARQCSCARDQNILDENVIDSLRIGEEEVLALAEDSLKALNNSMQGTGISCDYDILEKKVENIIHRGTIESAGCSCYEAESGWFSTPDENAVICMQWLDTGLVCPPIMDSDVVLTVEPIYERSKSIFSPTHQTGNHDLVGMERNLALSYNVKCTDSTTRIATESGLKPFTAEIIVKVSLRNPCPRPPPCNVNDRCDTVGSSV